MKQLFLTLLCTLCSLSGFAQSFADVQKGGKFYSSVDEFVLFDNNPRYGRDAKSATALMWDTPSTNAWVWNFLARPSVTNGNTIHAICRSTFRAILFLKTECAWSPPSVWHWCKDTRMKTKNI